MQRIQELDNARGLTVLFITPIHCFMVYGNADAHSSMVGYFLRFMAEGPGAQLFMFHMGFGLMFSKVNADAIWKRAFILILMAYSLNLLKFILPFLAGILPKEVIQELGLHNHIHSVMRSFFVGDILHFAGIALPLLYYLKKLSNSLLVIFLLVIIVFILSVQGFNTHSLYLINGFPPEVYFPLIPWLVYPLIGMFMGYFVRENYPKIFAYAGLVGMVVFIFSLLDLLCSGADYGLSFYHPAPIGLLMHVGFVLIWVFIWHIITSKTRDNILFCFFRNCSKHITLIYCIQWILIPWCLPLFGYQKLSPYAAAIAACLMTLLVMGAVKKIEVIRKRLNYWRD